MEIAYKILNVVKLGDPYSYMKATNQVHIEDTPEALAALKSAVALVDKYKNAAYNALAEERIDPRLSDWQECEFRFVEDKVILTIADGMAG